MERRGGKMRARALLATAPIREIRSSRSGTAKAIPAEVSREVHIQLQSTISLSGTLFLYTANILLTCEYNN